MIIGEIVETLIGVKDHNKSNLTHHEIEAINEACNVLDKRFNGFSDSYNLRNEHIASVHWMQEDIKTALKERNYKDTEENIELVLNVPKLASGLVERGCEVGWDVIDWAISEVKDNLEKSEEE